MSANEVKIWEQIDLNRDTDVAKELDDYEEVINKLHQGEIHPERFKSYRLLFGTYGVRHYGEGTHMIRIKVPTGFITSAFSECENDHAMVKIHDLGCVAQIRQNGGDIYGFKVFVGGGLGAIPFYAQPIVDFVPVDEFYPLAEAIIRIFHEYGTEERKNWGEVRRKCLDSILKCSKMYVFLDGIESEIEQEILMEFTRRIAPRDWLCHNWSDLRERYLGWKKSEDSKTVSENILSYTKEFIKDCDKAFVRLQPDLKIQACLEGGEEPSIPGE